jgi:hypothetical protein
VKPIIYVAHPVSTGNPLNNAHRAMQWLPWFMVKDPSRIYIIPWAAEVIAFADINSPPEFYQRVLDDDCEVVAALHGVVGVGGEGWTKGMAQERATARARNAPVLDMTRFAKPEDVPNSFSLEGEWSKAMPGNINYLEPY